VNLDGYENCNMTTLEGYGTSGNYGLLVREAKHDSMMEPVGWIVQWNRVKCRWGAVVVLKF